MSARPAPPVRLLAVLSVLLAASPAGAQTSRPASVTASAVVHRVLDDPALGDSVLLGHVALPVAVYASVAPGVDVSLRAAYVSSSLDGEGASGFADAQLGLSVRRAVAGGEVAVGLAATVPAGGGLTQSEAATAFLAAQEFYAFAAPTLRRGPSVTPSVSVAVPAGPGLVVGGGAAYRLRSGFEPRAGLDDAFDPGNELTLTAGLDALLPDGSTLAVDALYSRFGVDTYVRPETADSLEYATGDVFGVSAAWAGFVGATPVTVAAVARQKAESSVDAVTQTRLGVNAAVPAQARLAATAGARFGPQLTASVSAGARYYAASERFGSRALLDVAVAPAYRVDERVAVVGRLGGTVGSFTGVEVGLGLRVGL